ncbi:hypothetical protein FNF27_04037 [Cafeteria roenbergensis]|nr:hypothetical protein FNF31_03132 [Cafeteria roenbergensis]KAA0170746.1 hypothetical protein FNF28_01288 [Cafeteria roenbergensis]KAA0174439.1 hypothetical protein FNF27_04037 [Cafeteria roenbergensis]
MSSTDPVVEEDPGLAADREAVAGHLAKALSAVTGRFGSELDTLEAAQDSLAAKLAAAGAALAAASSEPGAVGLDGITERVRSLQARSAAAKAVIERVAARVARLEAAAGSKPASAASTA